MLISLLDLTAHPWDKDPIACDNGQFSAFNQCYTTTAAWTEAWVLVAVIVALVGFLAIWIASVREKGVAVGGTLGLIPAAVFAASSMVLWPVFLLVAIVYRARLFHFAKTTLALTAA